MKKITPIIVTILILTLFNCSPAEEIKDTLNAAECIEKISNFSDESDDWSCSRMESELKKLEKSCKAYLNDETRAQIALLIELCED